MILEFAPRGVERKDHWQLWPVDRVEVMEYPDGKKKGFGTVRFFKAEIGPVSMVSSSKVANWRSVSTTRFVEHMEQ